MLSAITAKRSLPNELPIVFILLLVVLCYFIYPSWKLLGKTLTWLTFFSSVYLVTIALAIRLWARFINSEEDQPDHTAGTAISKVGEVIGVFVLLLLFGRLQLCYLGLPILAGPDEPVHILRTLWQLELFRSIPLPTLLLHFACSLLLLFLLIVIAVPREKELFAGRRSNLLISYAPFVALVLLPIVLWMILQGAASFPVEFGEERRWPPLGTILVALTLSVGGINEFTARIPSLLFYCGTGLLIYRILKRELGARAGVVGLVTCLASPLFFSYGHFNYREAGGAFFLILAANSLFSYIKTANIKHLGFTVFAIAAGFLERRPTAIFILVAVVICGTYLFIVVYLRKDRTVSFMFTHITAQIMLALTVVLVVLPWILMASESRPYHFYRENFFRLEIVSSYLKMLPEFLPWPLVVLTGTGILAAFLKRQWSGIIALVCFIALYLLFTGDNPYWIPVERFAVLFIPFCSILVANNITFFKSTNRIGWIFFLLTILVSVNGLWGWATDDAGRGLLGKGSQTASDYPHYPFEDLVVFLRDQNIPRGNILLPAFWQTPFTIYTRMYKIQGYKEVVPPWKERNARKTNLQRLRKTCSSVRCQALIVPFVWKVGEPMKIPWIKDLSYDSISKNQVPGFEVFNIFPGKMKGLILMMPD